MGKLTINIDGNEYQTSYEKDGSIYVNEKLFNVELLKRYNENIYSFLVDNKVYHTEFDFSEKNKLNIMLDGMTFEISIADETQKLIDKFLSSSGSIGGAKKQVLVKSPMPGLVIKVFVEDGAVVNKNDRLLIVEAMKMENIVKSPVNGVVKKVRVEAGNPVEKDAILVEIEAGN